MTPTSMAGDPGRINWPWCRPVLARDAHAQHRQCTPLELLFDLCFVVAIAALALELHHAVTDGHAAEGALGYVVLFLPICWAWMLFSWFATAYDNDDVVYRLLTLGQMAGLLALTATIPAAFDGNLAPFVIGFVLMRVPLILKWVRAARRQVDEHTCAGRHVIGLTFCQLAWLAALALPAVGRPVLILVLMAIELAVPVWAVACAHRRLFHAHHISERFGLFTIIVIGESIFAAAAALREAVAPDLGLPMAAIGAATLLSAFCVWWLYFDVLDGRPLTVDGAHPFRWGHGHLLAFCAIGAMGAAAEVAVQAQTDGLTFTFPVRLAVVLPAALTVLALAWIRSLTARATALATGTRLVAATAIVAGGLWAGEAGPVAASLAVAAVLTAQAAFETIAHGLSVRRA